MQWPTQFPSTIHATSISLNDAAVLIVGPSGSGKSTLALQLIGLGSKLISDDITELSDCTNQIWASRPANAPCEVLIEARGFGLLSVPPAKGAPVKLIVDLSRRETARLPDPTFLQLGPESIRTCHKIESPALPSIILQYLSTCSDHQSQVLQ